MIGQSGRHYRKPALWKRIVKWSLLSLLIIVLGVGLAGFIFVYRTLGKIGLNTEVIYEAKQQLDIPMPDEPVNILVMGTDTSPDGYSTRSDSIMIVRVNPAGECLSMLSIPRDLLVDIPGVGEDKINAAYAIGGVPLSIETVKELTDLPIHHFVLVDYEGFEKAVDALGGVYVDIDRRYYNDNSQAAWGESYEPIDVYPGYQKLNGADALAYVRYRHEDSDFIRIKRQQYFIRDVKAQSLKWGNFTKIPDLADAFASYTTSDIGRTDVLSLTKFILSVDRDRIYQAQAPIQDMGGSYLVISEDQLPEIVEAFQSPEFNEPAPDVPEDQAPDLPSEATKQLAIEVLNGNGVAGAASEAAQMLTQKGCTSVAVTGNAASHYETSKIFYSEGAREAAAELATIFEPCEIELMPADLESSAHLMLVVGSSFDGIPVASQPGDQPNLHFDPESEASWDDWEEADDNLPFDVQKPTSFPVEFEYVNFHPYEIAGDDEALPALKVVAQDQTGNYWGIMETTFTEAPLLEAPSVERTVDGKDLRFFYTGNSLRYLAWQEGDVVYWISNSLEDSLQEDTMINLALSFKPVKVAQ